MFLPFSNSHPKATKLLQPVPVFTIDSIHCLCFLQHRPETLIQTNSFLIMLFRSEAIFSKISYQCFKSGEKEVD
jgi:hypothetical protein